MNESDTLKYKCRLDALRDEMKKEGIEIFIITGLDPGLSSSYDEHWNTLKFISGFTSKGDGSVLVTKDRAFFFSDSRYTDNIFNEISKDLFLLVPLQHTPTPQDEAFCFAANFQDFRKPNGEKIVIGFDASTVPFATIRKYITPERFTIKVLNNTSIKTPDILGRIWTDRPKIARHQFKDVENYVFDDSSKYIFESRRSKLDKITTFMNNNSQSIDAYLTTASNEIAYLLNLRSYEGGYSQTELSTLVIMPHQAYLFTTATVDPKALEDFNNIGSTIPNGVEKIYTFDFFLIDEMLPSLIPKGAKIGVSNGNLPFSLVSIFAKGQHRGFDIETPTPSDFMAIKSEGEVEGMRLSHINDGIAFARFLNKTINLEIKSRLDNDNSSSLTEEYIASSFKDEKRRINGYITESFKPIIAFDSNAKCPHYTIKKGESKSMSKNAPTLMLMDVGSQYEYGTTDFTRTIALNGIKDEWIRDYTLVLKAHLNVIMGRYKINHTTPYMLDTIARCTMWNNSVDFDHGTGHSIDCWGNVHGLYPRLSNRRSKGTDIPLCENMIFSVEPGLYSRSDYGIRIENVVVVKRESSYSAFYTLESLTLCPYDRNLIDKSALTREMITYINNYHQRVYNTLLPYLSSKDDEETLSNLKELTKPL